MKNVNILSYPTVDNITTVIKTVKGSMLKGFFKVAFIDTRSGEIVFESMAIEATRGGWATCKQDRGIRDFDIRVVVMHINGDRHTPIYEKLIQKVDPTDRLDLKE